MSIAPQPIGKTEKDAVTTAPVTRKPAKHWTTMLWLVLGSILLDFLYCRRTVSGLVNPDAMDFAQCAHNLVQGHGFVTQILPPLALTQNTHGLAQPDMVHGVLYPFVLALGFGMFGAKDAVVIAISGLFYVLTVPLIYLLGRRLFGAKVGWIAALIFLTNGTILEYAASGTHITLSLFLATGLFYALHVVATAARSPEPANRSTGKSAPPTGVSTATVEDLPPPKSGFLLAGILTGLLYLTDPLFLWVAPLMLIMVFRMYPRRYLPVLLWFGAPLLALLLPCMARFGALTGNPFFGLRGAELWMGTDLHPGLIGYRIFAEHFYAETGTMLSVMRKLCLALIDAIALLPKMPGSWILLFIAPSLVYQYSNPSATRLRSILLWCLVTMLMGSLFFSPNPIRLMIVFPALLIFAVAFLLHTVEAARLKPEKQWAVGAVLGMALLSPLAGDVIKTRYPVKTPEAAIARELARQMPAGDLCFSDQPWMMAWYGERASIWMPYEDQSIADLRKQFPQARWLFLTRQTPGLSSEWDETYRSLMAWNQQYRRAQGSEEPLPSKLRIPSSPIPLLKALEGFVTTPPFGEGAPTVIVAEAPASTQKAALP